MTRLNLLAGRFAAGLSGLSQFSDRTDLARAFATLAEQHAAAAVEDPHGYLDGARATTMTTVLSARPARDAPGRVGRDDRITTLADGLLSGAGYDGESGIWRRSCD